MSIVSHGFGRFEDITDVPDKTGNEGKFLGVDALGNLVWETPAGSGGGGLDEESVIALIVGLS
jgi:hypothetical protein